MKSAPDKPTLAPKLRFPEFRRADGWEDTILASVLTEHGEKNDGASEVHSVSVHKGVINQIEHLGRSFAAADRSNYNLAKPHDIIYTKSPTGDFPWGVVKQNRLPYNVIVSPLYGVFSPVNRHLGYILDAYFESPIRTTNYLAPITQKGAKNTIQISNATFLSKGLYLPRSEAEHKKIASCLSSLDDLIGAESQKLAALKAHKKGLMQQLFPREGETVPRLRFPEFQSAPEWVNKPLGELGEIVTGKTPSTKDTKLWGGAILFITPTDISEDGKYQHKTERTVVETGSTKVLPPGAVVYTCIASIGKMAITVCPSVTNQQINAVIAREVVTGEFIYYALLDLTPWIKTIPASSTLSIINKTEFSKIGITYPEDKTEQQSVVDCLSTLDGLIAAQAAKIDALSAHKKGLMQQLFPSPASESVGA